MIEVNQRVLKRVKAKYVRKSDAPCDFLLIGVHLGDHIFKRDVVLVCIRLLLRIVRGFEIKLRLIPQKVIQISDVGLLDTNAMCQLRDVIDVDKGGHVEQVAHVEVRPV